MENVIKISDYLQGRRFNRKMLDNAGKAITPAINEFNENNERTVSCEWSMSAKYQTGTLFIEMDDGDNLSIEAKVWIEDVLSELLEQQFGYWYDEDDVRDSYASLSVGF